jgi:hypothetical protein
MSHYSKIIAKTALMVVFFSLVATTASGATVRGLSLTDLVDHSDVVLRGRAVAARALADPRMGVVRAVAVEVDERLAGDCGDRVEVLLLGGELATTATRVPGAADIRVGDEVLLFLAAVRGEERRYRVVGMSQGAFRVLRDPEGGGAFAVRDVGALNLIGSPTEDELGLARACTSTFLPLERLEALVRDTASGGDI